MYQIGDALEGTRIIIKLPTFGDTFNFEKKDNDAGRDKSTNHLQQLCFVEMINRGTKDSRIDRMIDFSNKHPQDC